MTDWDWSLRIFDHVDVHASDYVESVRFYETVLTPLGIPKLYERDDSACFTHVNLVAQSPPTGAKVHEGDVVWLQVARR